MDKDKIIKSISDQLEDIQDQFDIIKGREGKIPSIELDLVMDNIRKVYESFLHLEKVNQPVVSFTVEDKPAIKEEVNATVEEKIKDEPREDVKEIIDEKKVEEDPEAITITEETVDEDIKKSEPSGKKEPDKVKEEEVKAPSVDGAQLKEEEKEEPAPAVFVEPAPEPVTVTREEPVKEEASNVKTTLDLFGEQSSTLADRLKETSETRVADKLKTNKIIDIKGAIGINEKFLFINELFEGSLKNYEDSINKLNNCQSGEQAGNVLTELQDTFGWDNENITAKSFIDLVNRKF